MKQTPRKHVPALRDLYPSYNEKQLKTAEANLDRYLKVVLRVYERLLLDPELYSQFQNEIGSLTDPRNNDGMKERSRI